MAYWLIVGKHGSSWQQRYNAEIDICPTICASGMACFAYHLEDDGVSPRPMIKDPNKPAYRVPTLTEVAAVPWNGYKVASTFSGCGGSCLGYRMAGFKVVWANEFVPAAQDSYRLNAAKDSYLSTKDVRQVSAEDVLREAGVARGELDVFDGSPPCQAFSTAGKTSKNWGKGKRYEHGAVQDNEDLFFEYVRLVDGIRPKVFIAENVSGMVKGVAKGYFIDVMRKLRGLGYRVDAQLLDAQWLGVPQTRSRIIFMGVREDLGIDPVFPKPLPYRYSIREALPWLESAKVKHVGGSSLDGKESSMDEPAPTVMAGGIAGGGRDQTVVQHVSKGYAGGRKRDIGFPAATITTRGMGPSSMDEIVLVNGAGIPLPPSNDENEVIDREVKALKRLPGARMFTIMEIRRLCGFPDDFQLAGSFTQRWERLGNAVPPVMMSHVARSVAGVLDRVNATRTKPVKRPKAR